MQDLCPRIFQECFLRVVLDEGLAWEVDIDSFACLVSIMDGSAILRGLIVRCSSTRK